MHCRVILFILFRTDICTKQLLEPEVADSSQAPAPRQTRSRARAAALQVAAAQHGSELPGMDPYKHRHRENKAHVPRAPSISPSDLSSDDEMAPTDAGDSDQAKVMEDINVGSKHAERYEKQVRAFTFNCLQLTI